MAVIVVPNIKGGVGKSTTTMNLAAQLQLDSNTVLIVETDPSVQTLTHWAADREESGRPPISVIRKEGAVHRTLQELAQAYDFVLVDVPGKDSKEMRTALTASDIAVIPVLPSQPDVDATLDMLDILHEAREYNEALQELIVLTKVPTHTFSKEADQAKIILEKNARVAQTRIHERAIYRSTISEGSSVPESTNSKAKAEMRGLTNEILSLLKQS